MLSDGISARIHLFSSSHNMHAVILKTTVRQYFFMCVSKTLNFFSISADLMYDDDEYRLEEEVVDGIASTFSIEDDVQRAEDKLRDEWVIAISKAMVSVALPAATPLRQNFVTRPCCAGRATSATASRG